MNKVVNFIALGFLLTVVLWAILNIPSGPQILEGSYGESAYYFEVDASRVSRPGECFEITWDTSNIREIRLMNEDTVGTGNRQVCERVVEPVYFEVVYSDGALRLYQFDLSYNAILPGVVPLVALTVLVWLYVFYKLILLLPKPILSYSLLFIVGILLLSGVFFYAIQPMPQQISEQIDNTEIFVSVESTRLLNLRSCYTSTWRISNIDAVYFNGQASTGERTETVCNGLGANPYWLVVLPGGDERVFELNLSYVMTQFPVLGFLVAGIILTLLGGYSILPRSIISSASRLFMMFIRGISIWGLVLFAAVGYGLTVVIDHIDISILGLLLLISIITGIAIERFYSTVSVQSRRPAKPIFLLLVVPFIPPIISQLNSIHAQLSADGRIHLSYIYRILRSGINPENIWMAGEPAAYYWMYHALIAAPAAALNIQPALMAFLIQSIVLAFIVYWVVVLTREAGFVEQYDASGLANIWFVLFGANFFGIVYMACRWWTEGADFGLTTWMFLPMFGHPNTAHILAMIQRMTGAQMGILFLMIAFVAIGRLLRNGWQIRSIILLGMAGLGTLAFHATSGLVLILCVPLAAILLIVQDGVTVNLKPPALSQHLNNTFAKMRVDHILIVAVCFMLIALPVLLYVLGVSTGSADSLGLTTDFWMVVWAIGPMLPLTLIGIHFAKRDGRRDLVFFGIFALTATAVAYSFDLLGQEDKFVLPAQILMVLVALYVLQLWGLETGWRKELAGFIRFLAVLTTLLFAFTRAFSVEHHWSIHYDHFTVDGLNLSQPRNEDDTICAWVRQNTPDNAVLVENDNSPWNSPIYLCQRSVFLSDEPLLTRTLEGFTTRFDLLNILYDSDSPSELRLEAMQKIRTFEGILGRPVYLRIDGNAQRTLAPYLPEPVISDDDRFLYNISDEID